MSVAMMTPSCLPFLLRVPRRYSTYLLYLFHVLTGVETGNFLSYTHAFSQAWCWKIIALTGQIRGFHGLLLKSHVTYANTRKTLTLELSLDFKLKIMANSKTLLSLKTSLPKVTWHTRINVSNQQALAADEQYVIMTATNHWQVLCLSDCRLSSSLFPFCTKT